MLIYRFKSSNWAYYMTSYNAYDITTAELQDTLIVSFLCIKCALIFFIKVLSTVKIMKNTTRRNEYAFTKCKCVQPI